MGESARGLLTHHGVRGLFWNSSTSNDVRLQVLGVYRYLVDPALKQRLGPEIEGERDAFDILLSDGIHKMKAVLSPALNELVWKRDIAVQKIISVTKFGVFNEDPEDEQRKQRICVLLEVSVVDIGDNVEVSEKIFDRRFGAYNRQECLDFVSTAHPRDVELVPLAGERLYYLPLRSDHYVLDWACSFTDGVAEKESPLDELEINWASRYAGMVAADDAVGDHAPKRTLAMTWNTTPIYCASLFTDKLKRIPKVLEALEMIETGSNPPLTGAVRVKSKVIHVGDPNIPNSFPFVFNIILGLRSGFARVVDTQGAFEVAFYGSMCAKYFLSLHEGDLIQLRGYSSIYPREIGSTTSITPVLYYEHESSGSVFHVPKKYWRVLEMINKSPPLLHVERRANALQQSGATTTECDACSPTYHQCSSWLECSFVNTLNTLYWGKSAIKDVATMYFDFVGVLSNVGKICRTRKRKLGQDAEVTEFRWVKAIDNSSSYELVIKIQELSQPAVFRTLKAGDTFMITKLQWVILPDAAVDARNQIQYAVSSIYSVLRVNEAICPFHSLDECNLNSYFASNVKKNAVVEIKADTGESKLAAYIEKKYRPRNCLHTEADLFKEAFGLEVLPFRDLARLLSKMEDLEHQHVGVVARVLNVRTMVNTDDASKARKILLELSEDSGEDGQDLSKENEANMLTVHAAGNPLYQTATIKGSIKTITPRESLPLIRLLPPDITDDMYTKAVKSLPGSKLSLEFIKNYLSSVNKEYLFSVHLFQDAERETRWEVDAILHHKL